MTEVVEAESDVDGRAGLEPSAPGSGLGSLGSIVYVLALTWTAAIASYPQNDNSFFTHLATGRRILDAGGVPSSDPYTFTAQGEPWTVQSWLPSVAYAGAERVAGSFGLRLLVSMVFVAAMTLMWRLTRPVSSVLLRLLLLSAFLLVASGLWSARPYMVGVFGVALVWLAANASVRPWAVVPAMWFWVNSHGSWVLAFAVAGAVLGGELLDRRVAGQPLALRSAPTSTVLWLTAGAAIGALNPLGPKLLIFPTTALSQADVFADVVEWKATDFREAADFAFLALFVVALALASRRSSWRLLMPALVFGALGIYAQRNIVMAAVVLVGVVAECAPRQGSLRVDDKPPLGRALFGISGALCCLVAASGLGQAALPGGALSSYPAHSLAWLDNEGGIDRRLVAPDFVGNFLEVLEVRDGSVFVDDRYDMFPDLAMQDVRTVTSAEPGWEAVLSSYDVEVILWERTSPVGAAVAAHPSWVVRYSDATWFIACRRGSEVLCGAR